jgi:hypothetical protein
MTAAAPPKKTVHLTIGQLLTAINMKLDRTVLEMSRYPCGKHIRTQNFGRFIDQNPCQHGAFCAQTGSCDRVLCSDLLESLLALII